MKLDQFLSKIYPLAFVTRYSNQVRIRDESVAQHTFFVAAIVMWLWEHYDFNLEIALMAAVSHDMIEAGVGDTTQDVKIKYPELNKAIKEAEKKEILEFPRIFQKGFAYFENSSSIAGIAARLADAIQVDQYVSTEISLGNTTLLRIKEDVKERIEQLTKELTPYER